MTVLPSRPFPLSPKALAKERRRVLLLSLLFIVVGAGFAAGFYFFSRETLRHREIWTRGEPGQITELSGEVKGSGKLGITLLYEYKLQVSFLDAQGQTHSGPVEFTLFWNEADESEAPELRYLAEDPSAFTLTPAAASGAVALWGFQSLMAVLALLMLVALIGTARQHQKRNRILTLVAEDGEEILAEVIRSVAVQGTHSVSYRLPDDGKTRSENLNAPPLLAERAGRAMVVVLRSPRDPESCLVMREDLSPFAFDDETKALIATRLSETNPSS